jgi:hypothetical protein
MLFHTRWGPAAPTVLSGRATSRRRRTRFDARFEREGALAYAVGIPSTRNPYHGDTARKLWTRGWHRARMAAQVAKVEPLKLRKPRVRNYGPARQRR